MSEAIESVEAANRQAIEVAQEKMNSILNDSFAPASRKRLSEVAILERGRFNHRPRNAPHLYEGGTYPFIQTGDVASSLGQEIKCTQYLNDAGANVSKLFQPGTIFITIAANIGSTAILTYEAYAPDSIVGVTPKDSQLNVKYLEHFLRTQKSYLEEIAPQNAQKNINLQTLEPLLIAYPPRSMQDEVMVKVEIEEQKIAAAQERLDAIAARRAAVLRKYL